MKISQSDAKIRLISLIKAKTSMRWYKDYRIDKIDETNESEVRRVYDWTKIYYRAKDLLPNVIDCDSLTIITTEHMPIFFKVLGTDRFCKHI